MKGNSLLVLIMGASSVAIADVYKWKDGNGVVHFSDDATGQAKVEKVDVKVVTYTHVTYQKMKARPAVAASAGKSVVMYGTSWCGYCKKARAYFRSRQIAFTELDVETDATAKAQFDAMGGGGVPVILVGDTRINGFSEAGFDGIYNQR